jgi:hypothetical protein
VSHDTRAPPEYVPLNSYRMSVLGEPGNETTDLNAKLASRTSSAQQVRVEECTPPLVPRLVVIISSTLRSQVDRDIHCYLHAPSLNIVQKLAVNIRQKLAVNCACYICHTSEDCREVMLQGPLADDCELLTITNGMTGLVA